jgi:hypothetical protein
MSHKLTIFVCPVSTDWLGCIFQLIVTQHILLYFHQLTYCLHYFSIICSNIHHVTAVVVIIYNQGTSLLYLLFALIECELAGFILPM